MAVTTWTDTCVHCAELLASVPLSIIFAAVGATAVGLFVCVCAIRAIDLRPR